MSHFRRRLVERKLKLMLLEEARRSGVSPRVVADWVYETAGIRVRGDWTSIERAILKSDDITAQELAVFLQEELGVSVDEEKWLSILRSMSLSVTESKVLGGKRGEGGGKHKDRMW